MHTHMVSLFFPARLSYKFKNAIQCIKLLQKLNLALIHPCQMFHYQLPQLSVSKKLPQFFFFTRVDYSPHKLALLAGNCHHGKFTTPNNETTILKLVQ